MDTSSYQRLVRTIREARTQLPTEHQQLLDSVNVQDAVVERWPDQVLDLHRTLLAEPPARATLDGAAAVYLPHLRVVAFNAVLLERALEGLEPSSWRLAVLTLARHEWGHALSVTRASSERRAGGPRLLELAPEGVRAAIVGGGYARREIFDELMAWMYGLMVDRYVRGLGYGRPVFVSEELMSAFEEVFSWPPSR